MGQNRENAVATETVENYLKAIYTLCRESPTGEAGMTRLAVAVGVTTGTATAMVKKLAAGRFVKYERFGGVSLAPKGRRAALDIIRRHRIIETFLVQTLKLDWSAVHAEAERLEHAVSPVVLEALDDLLGRPAVDPHGDPIPDARGRTRKFTKLTSISDCKPGARVRLARVLNQGADFLRFLDRHHVKLDAVLTIEDSESDGGVMTVRTESGGTVVISKAVAGSLLVRVAGSVRALGGARPTDSAKSISRGNPEPPSASTRSR